jgi:acetolactate synthase-1/3 small subunit
VDCSQTSIDQVVKQLYKLVNVLKVTELRTDAIERELILVRVAAPPERRPEIIDLAAVFGARVVDVSPGAVVFELVEHPERLAAFEELLTPYGIQEAVRTGRIGLGRPSTRRTRRLRVA